MSAQATFTPACVEAFGMMNTQESPNDFFVCGFTNDSHTMDLIESGKGGMERVNQILAERFDSSTAVAMFRVTAVDDRENTVSYRTKLVHVIFTGPNTPVMKRAKIASFNAAFKQPFTCNLAIQTDDIEGDLNPQSIERALRASGGAHQPTRFDFSNDSAPSEPNEANQASKKENPFTKAPSSSPSPVHRPSPASQSSSPVSRANRSTAAPPPISPPQKKEKSRAVAEIMQHHGDAVDARDIEGLLLDYTDSSQLIITDAATKQTTAFKGLQEIRGAYQGLFQLLADSEINVLKSESTDNVHRLEWSAPNVGLDYAMDAFVIVDGNILVQTVVTVVNSDSGNSAPVPEPEPYQEEETNYENDAPPPFTEDAPNEEQEVQNNFEDEEQQTKPYDDEPAAAEQNFNDDGFGGDDAQQDQDDVVLVDQTDVNQAEEVYANDEEEEDEFA